MILTLALPVIALADYSPKLGMTMEEFLIKYNSVAAPLGSPYVKLTDPVRWTVFSGYNVAWFNPAKDSSVIILLLSSDPAGKNNLSCGLDVIQICTISSKDFIDLISITARCAEPFSDDLFGTPIGDMRISQLIKYYYDNGYKGSSSGAYWSINDENKTVLKIFEPDGWYYFQISAQEDA